MEGINYMIKSLIGSYVLSMNDDEYLEQKETRLDEDVMRRVKRRRLKQLCAIIHSFAYALWFFVFAFLDQTYYNQMIGVPDIIFKQSKVTLILFGQIFLTCSCLRLAALKCEDYGRYDGTLQIFKSLRNPIRRGYLNSHYYYKLAWQVQLFGKYSVNIVPKFLVAWPVILLSYYIIFLSSFYENDYNDMRVENIIILAEIILLVSSHTIIFMLCVNLMFAGFADYYLPITYIRYRFEQVNHKIKKLIRLPRENQDYDLLMCAIEEHNQITVLCMNNNQFANLILLLIYYLYSPLIDMALYLAIYIDNFYFKLFLIAGTFLFILFLFLFSLTTAQLRYSAHFPYKNLNSIIAKQNEIPLEKKMKIVGLIERLAGPDIAVYCHDFFPLNNYEFYEFIAIISSNFFLLIGLID